MEIQLGERKGKVPRKRSSLGWARPRRETAKTVPTPSSMAYWSGQLNGVVMVVLRGVVDYFRRFQRARITDSPDNINNFSCKEGRILS
jgi:hypothetical protein